MADTKAKQCNMIQQRYWGADKSLARPEGNKLGSMAGTRAISTTPRRELSSSSPPPLQGMAPKEIHAILTETLACFLPGRAKDLSAPLYKHKLLCHSNNSDKHNKFKKPHRRHKNFNFVSRHARSFQSECVYTFSTLLLPILLRQSHIYRLKHSF